MGGAVIGNLQRLVTVELKDACGQEKGNSPLFVSVEQSSTVTADGLSA